MSELPRLSPRDAAATVADVVAPLVARGLVARRRRVLAALDAIDADRRAVRRMQRLRARYGPGPVVLPAPRREIALVLSPADVRRVLAETPEPFSPATLEKRAALARFQPHGVLISTGAARVERRGFVERVLEPDDVHRLAGAVAGVAEQEGERLARAAVVTGTLAWDGFARAWWRIARRIVLGDAAREDAAVTDLLAALRRDANWGYLRPRRDALRDRFLGRVEEYVAQAEADSLAALVAATPAPVDAFPAEQVPHWLFAFDAAGMATFRALALLDAHPPALRRAVSESASDGGASRLLPFLRACILESVRLWPTTPAVLRDTTADTAWEGGVLRAGAALVIVAPYFHRDARRGPEADRFAPELWDDVAAAEAWPLIPFSAGPAACPGRNLVLRTTSCLLAALLGRLRLRQAHSRPLRADRPLPGTLSPFRLCYDARPV
jgi:cytochrome P450